MSAVFIVTKAYQAVCWGAQVRVLVSKADDKVRACAIRNMQEALASHVQAHRCDAARRYAIKSSQKTLYFRK